MTRRVSKNHLISKILKSRIESVFEHNNDFCYVIWSASKIVVDAGWCFPRKSYKFEGLNVYSFHRGEKYLLQHYGDNYIDLPPDELRRVGINRIEVI